MGKDAVEELYEQLTDKNRHVRSTRQLLDSLAARRRETVLALIDVGQTYSQIADAMGVSKSAVQQIVGRG